MPEDLRVLVQTMEETVLSQVSKMLETSAAPEGKNLTPGSYPMGGRTETSVSSAIAVRSPLQVSTLTINFTEDREILNTGSKSNLQRSSYPTPPISGLSASALPVYTATIP